MDDFEKAIIENDALKQTICGLRSQVFTLQNVLNGKPISPTRHSFRDDSDAIEKVCCNIYFAAREVGIDEPLINLFRSRKREWEAELDEESVAGVGAGPLEAVRDLLNKVRSLQLEQNCQEEKQA